MNQDLQRIRIWTERHYSYTVKHIPKCTHFRFREEKTPEFVNSGLPGEKHDSPESPILRAFQPYIPEKGLYQTNIYREEGFPVTIVRPSHTYDEKNIPLGVHGKNGFWQVIKRMPERRSRI